MYQLDEKLMADNRAIISIAPNKTEIEPNLKSGMQVFDANTRDTYVVSSKQRYNRLIQEDAYTHKIHYDLTFAGNITVDKNLIVKGNLTNLETQDLIIKDNIIELNKDETGEGISKGSSGLEINRGTKERPRFLFTETTDRPSTAGFAFDLNNKHLLYLYETGDMKIGGTFTTNHLIVQNDLSVGRDLLVKRNTTLQGSLSTTGSTTLKNTLTVKGSALFESPMTLKATLNVSGATILENTLRVKDAVVFDKTLQTIGNIQGNGSLTIYGSGNFRGILDVAGATTLRSTLTVGGATTLNSTLSVKENTTLQKDLIVKGNTQLQGTATITGSLQTTNITNSNHLLTKTLTVSEATELKQTLTVQGLATFYYNTDIKGSLTVTNATSLKSALTVAGMTSVKDLIVNGATSIKGPLAVAGATTLNNTLTVKQKATFNDDLQVNKNTFLDQTLHVTGDSTLGNVAISKNLSVDGTTTLNQLNVSGNVGFTGVANAINLKVETLTLHTERNAIKWLDNSLTHMLYGSASNVTNRGYSLFDKAINDYNVIFKTEPAVNKEKGFVFVNGTKPIFHINQTSTRTTNNIYIQRGSSWSPVLTQADQHKANHSIGGHDALAPKDIGATKNTKDTPELITDLERNRPAAGILGRLFFAKDTKRIWQDLGNTWQIIGGQDTIKWESISNKPETFTPPIATATQLGGVKIGHNIFVDVDGTINVPKQTIEYTVHVDTFTATKNQTTFVLSKNFLTGRNHVSPYLYGRRIPSSAFTETNDNTIVFKEGLPEGALLEFYILLIPSDLSFVMKVEEFHVATNQTTFVLSQGKYTVGANKLKIFLNGALMPRSAFIEVDASTIQLKQSPGVGNHILIEYMYDPLA